MEANCGPLSLNSLIGIPYLSKMLLRMLMLACDDKVVSFLRIGNLQKISPASRYVFPSQEDKSTAIVCQAWGGTSWLCNGSRCCAGWYFWHVGQLVIMFSMSLGMLTQNTAVRASNLVFLYPGGQHVAGAKRVAAYRRAQ